MFNTDLLCLFGFDGGWDVKEGFPCFGTVLYDIFNRGQPLNIQGEGGGRTSLISSTAKYASVGIPITCGRTSTITMTGLAMNRLNRSLIS